MLSFEAFQPQNNFILFLFSIKTSCLLMVKNTLYEIVIVYC